ncbi:ligand-gated channel protein [Geomonas sp. Red276]
MQQCSPKNRSLCLLLLAAALLLGTGVSSRADDDIRPGSEDLTELSLDQLTTIEVAKVYGASRFEQKVTEAPSSVSIVTADDIRAFGYRNLSDILAAQRGFYVYNDRNYDYIGARGVDRSGGYDSRVLVLVDGHRTNEDMYDSAFIGNEFVLDADLIDRVEIIRGPGSSLYGDNAFFGVINIITRHGKLQGTEVSAEAGSQQSYKGRVTYGNRFQNGLAVTLSGAVADSQGDKNLYFPAFNTPANNNGVAHDLDYERYHSLFSTFSFGDFTLQGAYSTRTKGVPTASFDAVFNDPRFHTTDSRGYVDLKYEHAFGSWQTSARGYFDYYNYYENIPLAAADPAAPPVLNRDSALDKWYGIDVKAANTFGDHRVVAGADYQADLTQLFDNHDIDPFHQYLKVDRTTWRWASYLQDQYTITSRLILNAGVRLDHYSTFGDAVSPRAGLIYSPLDATTFKLLYGEAFRAPNSYELYYEVPDFNQKGNDSLRPEKIRSYEIDWEQGLGEHFRSTVAGYYNKVRGMIKQVNDPNDGMLVFENIAGVTALGAEAELEGKWSNGFQGRASYTFQDARDDQTGALLVNSPRHMAKLNLIAPLYRKALFSGIELQYMSSRKTLAGGGAGDHLLTNLTLFSRDVYPGLEVSGSVYNLFDTRYGDPGSGEHAEDVIPRPGRIFRLKLTYRF